jgi:hypothetical protein
VCDIHDPLPAQLSQLRCQLVALIQFSDIISTSDSLSAHKNIRDCATTGFLSEQGLQIWTEWVLVQFNYERLWLDRIVVEQDRLGSLTVGAIRF